MKLILGKFRWTGICREHPVFNEIMILVKMILGKFRGHPMLIGNQEFSENDTGEISRCIENRIQNFAIVTPSLHPYQELHDSDALSSSKIVSKLSRTRRPHYSQNDIRNSTLATPLTDPK